MHTLQWTLSMYIYDHTCVFYNNMTYLCVFGLRPPAASPAKVTATFHPKAMRKSAASVVGSGSARPSPWS